MPNSFSALARSLSVPLVILLMAYTAMPSLRGLPANLQFLIPLLPYVALILALVIALVLNLARLAFVAIVLSAGYWLLVNARLLIDDDPFRSELFIAAFAVLLPLNLALVSTSRERGLLSGRTLLLTAILVSQGSLIAWILSAQRLDFLNVVYREFLPWDGAERFPHAGVLAYLFIAGILTWNLSTRPSVLNAGLLLFVPILVAAALWADLPVATEILFMAMGLILAFGMVLETHRIAHRDDLTGLPSRRALNLRLATLGRRYVIAMVDVDHFKKFNDRHGHDVGDQVLRIVAAQLQRIRGGTAYRYGGEEFSIVFSRRDLDFARPRLEQLRQDIANYTLNLRGRDRPGSRRHGGKLRGNAGQKMPRKQSVNVTVSIGLAERNAKWRRATDVIRAADKALYRAKRGGRNRVKVQDSPYRPAQG